MKQNEHVSIKKASLINGISKYTNIVFNLFFSAILARILSPEDYGIVAITTVFTNFFILLSDMGIGPAIIQNKEIDTNDANRIFSFSLLFGVFLGIVFFLFSFLLVKIYDNPVYIGIGALLGLSIAITTFNVVPNAVLMKRKQFSIVAVRTVTTNILGYLAALVLALKGAKYYSIVCQSAITALLTFIWNEYHVRLTPALHGVNNSLNKIKAFSLFQMAFSFLNYFTRNLDNFLVGYYLGEAQLGFYDKAYRLVRYPVTGFTDVLSPAILPVLSDYQNNKEYIINKYVQFVKILSLIGIYLSVVCYYSSREIIMLFFGNQWEKSIKPFQILSLTIWPQMIAGMIGGFYQCLGKVKYMFYSSIQNVLIIVPCIILGTSIGTIESLALCYTIGFSVSFVRGQWYLARYGFNISVLRLFKQYIPELIIAYILFGLLHFAPSLSNIFVSLIWKAVLTLILFGIMIIASKEYTYLLLLLPEKIKRLLYKTKSK